MKFLFKHTILSIIFAQALVATVFASADVDSIVEQIKFGSGKTQREYVLMNSSINPAQWYYALLTPKLLELPFGKHLAPYLSLLRFQKLDTKNPEMILDGAILSFSFSIGAERADLISLKKNLPKGVDSRKIRLDPLPLDGIDLAIFDPLGKKLQLTASTTPGIAAEHSTQYAYFSTKFNKVEADLLASLLNSTAGIKYEINYKYGSLGKKKNHRLQIDTNKKTLQYDDQIDSESSLPTELERYMHPRLANPRIIQRLNKATQTTNTNDSESETPYDPRTDGRTTVQTTKISQPVKVIQTLKEINLIHRTRTQKYLAGQGFLSLYSYPDAVKQNCFIEDTSYDNWTYAYFMIPSVGELPNLSINKVTLAVSLCDEKHTYETAHLTWTTNELWRDSLGSPVSLVRFDLKDILQGAINKIENVFFKIQYSIYVAEDPAITDITTVPAFTGDMPISPPFELVDLMILDFTNLYWDAPESDKSRLTKIELIMQDGTRRIRRSIAPQKADGVLLLPERLPLLLTKGHYPKPGKIKLTINFYTANNKKIPWDFNSMPLYESFPDAYLVFLDNDWQIYE